MATRVLPGFNASRYLAKTKNQNSDGHYFQQRHEFVEPAVCVALSIQAEEEKQDQPECRHD